MNNGFIQQGQSAFNLQTIRSIKYDRQYKILDQIGSGAEGIVYKGEEILPGGKEIVAIKLQRILNQQSIVEQFSQKKFKNIINVRDIITTPSGTYVVMDYADGEFFKYMQSQEFINKSTREKTDLFKQIVCGVEELHEMKIIHRDLKPENILYIRLKNGSIQLKLADFGLIKSNMENQNPLKTANIGTPYYWAPEIISLSAYTNYAENIDIWALGMIWYEMIKGTPMLLEYQTVQNIKQHLLNLKQNWINEQVDKVSEFNLQEKNILKTHMLAVQANQRKTAKYLKETLIEISKQQSAQNNSLLDNNQPSLQQDNQLLLKFNPSSQIQIPFKQGNYQQNQFPHQPLINNPIQLQFNQQQPQQQFNNNNFKQVVPQNQSQFILNNSKIQLFKQQRELDEGNSRSIEESCKRVFQYINHQPIEVCLTVKSKQTIQLKNELKESQLKLSEKQIEVNLYKKEQENFKSKLIELQKFFEIFQQELIKKIQKAIENIESNLKQKENQTREILSRLLYISKNAFNKKILDQQKQQISELQLENQKVKQQIQKQLEEKQQILNQKFQIEQHLSCKMQEFQKQEQQKQNLELVAAISKEKIEEMNIKMSQLSSEFQLQKQQLEKSIVNFNKLQQEVLDKEQQKQNLLSKLDLERNNCQKIQQDQNKEKQVMLNYLIKPISQILQFQVMYFSKKLKKINNQTIKENAEVQQYLETLLSEQRKQTESIQKIEMELIGIRDNNQDYINELYRSVQKIVLDVGNNINKNYQELRDQNQVIKDQKQFSVKQQKKFEEIQEKPSYELEVEKLRIFHLTLNEVQSSMRQLQTQIISQCEESMKLILTQIMTLQNQFETEFFQVILLPKSIKQFESIDVITQRLNQITLTYLSSIEGLKSQPLGTKSPQLQNYIDSSQAEEISRLQEELEKLEKQNLELNYKINFFPEDLNQIRAKVGSMIQTIQQFKKNESKELQRAVKEFKRLTHNNDVQICFLYRNFQQLLDLERELQNQETYFSYVESLLYKNKKIMEEKQQVELQMKNQSKQIKQKIKQDKTIPQTYLREIGQKPPFKF